MLDTVENDRKGKDAQAPGNGVVEKFDAEAVNSKENR